MNVALSRARNHLYIVGDGQNLRSNHRWSEVIDHCRCKLVLIGIMCFVYMTRSCKTFLVWSVSPNGFHEAKSVTRMFEERIEKRRRDECSSSNEDVKSKLHILFQLTVLLLG